MANPDDKLNDFGLPDQSRLLEPPTPHAAAFFDDAYDSVTKFAREEPLATALIGAAALGGLYYLTRGRAGAFRAGAGNLKTFEGAVIPNLERAQIAPGALVSELSAIEKGIQTAKAGYEADLPKLFQLPRTVTGMEGETGAKLAERIAQSRAAVTGERLTPEFLKKEATRLSNLNGGAAFDETDVAGRTFTAWTKEDLTKAAGDLSFKHVPQIGQFMKGTGKITEAHIEEALKIQRAIPADQPRKLLGELLVENKLAAQADVDLAFSRQNTMKSTLKQSLTDFLSTVE